MYRQLTLKGLHVPNGFAITAEVYRYVLNSANLWLQLHEALDALDINNVNDLAQRAKRCRELIYAPRFPPILLKRFSIIAGLTVDFIVAQLERCKTSKVSYNPKKYYNI